MAFRDSLENAGSSRVSTNFELVDLDGTMRQYSVPRFQHLFAHTLAPRDRIFEEHYHAMSRLKQRKAQLIEKIDAIQDEHMLDAVEKTLAGSSHYSLSPDQQDHLQESLARYLSGEAKTYSPEEAITQTRKSAHG